MGCLWVDGGPVNPHVFISIISIASTTSTASTTSITSTTSTRSTGEEGRATATARTRGGGARYNERRDCHIQILHEQRSDLAQFLSKSDAQFDLVPTSSKFRLTWVGSSVYSAFKNCTLGGGPVLTALFVARAHQPTLWVDLRGDGLHQPTLNIQSDTSNIAQGPLWLGLLCFPCYFMRFVAALGPL
jgi:hypothetical protein